MGVADARAMHPGIEVVEADPAADRRLLEALADWCDRYTPLVSFDGEDALFLDITGCSHLFGGEQALVATMVQEFAEQGFDARAAVASTPGTAWAVARFHGGCVVTEGEEAGWLEPLPLAALRLEAAVCTALHGVGLRTVGTVMAVPRAPLARRFGQALLLRLDQALGGLDETLSPRLPVPELSAERRLAEPIVTTEDVERLILLLATSLKVALERRGSGALALQLLLFRVDGVVARLAVGLSRPEREAERIARLFHERLAAIENGLETGYGFDLVRLSVLAMGALAPRQIDLADAGADDEADLALFVDRVCARLGTGAVRRPIAVASHVPERAVSLAPCSEALQAVPSQQPAPPAPERPLRLLRRPEPVQVMAGVPEGPPVQFRWRRAHYRIVRSEGPERIEPEWWREPVPNAKPKEGQDPEEARKQAMAEAMARLTRDYFRVEDAEGRRYWLYREGVYGRTGEAAPGWFLQGMFA